MARYVKSVHTIPPILDPSAHATFLAIWCDQTRSLLMIDRGDGTFGFPGGKMDPSDERCTIKNVSREVQEEIGAIRGTHYSTIHPICSHVIQDTTNNSYFTTHLYATKVTRSEYDSIIQNAPTGRDYADEVAGIITVPIGTRLSCLFDPSELAPSVREELERLEIYFNELDRL